MQGVSRQRFFSFTDDRFFVFIRLHQIRLFNIFAFFSLLTIPNKNSFFEKYNS